MELKTDKKISFRALIHECYEEADKQNKLAGGHDDFEKAYKMQYHVWVILAHHFEAMAQDPPFNLEQFTFIDVLIDAEKKYQRKIPLYGETWKTMPIESLENKLQEETVEYLENVKKADKAQELLDIINVACMLAMRLKVKKCNQQQ